MKYILGIQWLGQQLKIACFKKDDKKIQLVKLDVLNISSLPKWVADNLPQGVQLEAVLTIPESAVFLKELVIPLLNDQEMKEAVFWEAANAFPFSASEAVVGWQKISQKADTQTISVIAIKDEIVQKYYETISQAGINVSAIEPNSLSLARLVKQTDHRPVLLVLVEEEETNFVVLKKGFPVFSTSISLKLLGMKKQTKKLDKNVKSVLAANAKKMISFWEAKEKEKIALVLIAGSGIKYSGLAVAINHFAHIPVLIAKTKSQFPISVVGQPKASISCFIISIAAGLRSILAAKKEELNLLPKKESRILEKQKIKEKTQQKFSFFNRVMFILLLVSFLFLGVIKLWSFSIEKELRQVKIMVDKHPAQKLIPEVNSINKLLAEASLLIKNQKDISQRLNQFNQLVPVGVNFDSLQFNQLEQEQWEIKGVGSREEILAFYYQLKVVPEINRISMPYSNLQKNIDNNFKIVILW